MEFLSRPSDFAAVRLLYGNKWFLCQDHGIVTFCRTVSNCCQAKVTKTKSAATDGAASRNQGSGNTQVFHGGCVRCAHLGKNRSLWTRAHLAFCYIIS